MILPLTKGNDYRSNVRDFATISPGVIVSELPLRWQSCWCLKERLSDAANPLHLSARCPAGLGVSRGRQTICILTMAYLRSGEPGYSPITGHWHDTEVRSSASLDIDTSRQLSAIGNASRGLARFSGR